MQEKRNTLRRQLEKWREIQLIYMPGVAVLRGTDTDPAAHDSTHDSRPELAKLWLPFQLPQAHRTSGCLRGVVAKEQRFRLAQIHDSLVELRRARRVYRGVILHFKINVVGTGQRMITKTRTIIINAANRITKAYNRYRACHAALLELDSNGKWQDKYLILNPGDNRGPGKDIDADEQGDNDKEAESDRNKGEGYRTMSWIWLVTPNAPNKPPGTASKEQVATALSTEEFHEAMRAEWTQVQARAERWEEEYDLVRIEMVRTWLFFQSKVQEWEQREAVTRDVSTDLKHGLAAYARKQDAMYRHLAHSFLFRWLSTLKKLDVDHSWFYLETRSILLQLKADPSRFLSEWDSICAELELPRIAARDDVPTTYGFELASKYRVSSVPQVKFSSIAARSTKKSQLRKQKRKTHPQTSSNSVDTPIPVSVVDTSEPGERTLRQRPVTVKTKTTDEDSDDPEDLGDEYLDQDEKEEYDSDDLDIECDD